MNVLLPRARLRDVLRRRAPLIGSRLDPTVPRGFASPIEPRLLLGLAYGDLLAEERRCIARRSFGSDLALLMRCVVAKLLAPPAGSTPKERPWIVSAGVNNLGIQEALDRIFAAPFDSRARMVHFAHAHCLNVAYRDAELAQRLAEADLTLPDGIGIRLAGVLLGVGLRANLNGTDLWPMLVERAAESRIAVALVGGEPEVAARCAERIRERRPDLRIPIVSHGYLSAREASEVAERIAGAAPCLVLVGMGTPLQEAWAWNHLAGHPGLTVVTVGGLFDFISEHRPRAPQAWRELGLEWAYRLIQEPGRLWRRYLVGNLVFLFRALRQRVRGKG